jgi:hypothetical protein
LNLHFFNLMNILKFNYGIDSKSCIFGIVLKT